MEGWGSCAGGKRVEELKAGCEGSGGTRAVNQFDRFSPSVG